MLRASRCVAQGSDAGVGTVIAYCTIGVRSGFLVRSLRRRGVNAVNMAGSILSWCHAGGELVDGVTGAETPDSRGGVSSSPPQLRVDM